MSHRRHTTPETLGQNRLHLAVEVSQHISLTVRLQWKQQWRRADVFLSYSFFLCSQGLKQADEPKRKKAQSEICIRQVDEWLRRCNWFAPRRATWGDNPVTWLLAVCTCVTLPECRDWKQSAPVEQWQETDGRGGWSSEPSRPPLSLSPPLSLYT